MESWRFSRVAQSNQHHNKLHNSPLKVSINFAWHAYYKDVFKAAGLIVARPASSCGFIENSPNLSHFKTWRKKSRAPTSLWFPKSTYTYLAMCFIYHTNVSSWNTLLLKWLDSEFFWTSPTNIEIPQKITESFGTNSVPFAKIAERTSLYIIHMFSKRKLFKPASDETVGIAIIRHEF